MRSLILGLGNPNLSDDSVGIVVAERLKKRFRTVDVLTTSLAGINILELLEGYDKLFLIGAVSSKDGKIGELQKSKTGENSLHLFSSQGIDFLELLRRGELRGLCLPKIEAVFGIGIGDRHATFGDLSIAMQLKIEAIIAKIYRDIFLNLSKMEFKTPDRINLSHNTKKAG